jgi:feruloyl esterase
MSQDALDFLQAAVLRHCDALDGVDDGLLANPEACHLPLSSLQCSGDQLPVVNNATVCLTSAQVDNARLFYSGPINRDTGASVYPGFAPGSEAEWMTQETTLWVQYGIPILQNLVFRNLSYDYHQFNWGSDVDRVDQTASPLIDETSANLTTFQQRGGKLLVTQGWADPYNAPGWPIQQREAMLDIFGDELDTFFGLFMVPGGGHCGGADSYPQMPGKWHTLDVLVPWVEDNSSPGEILASDPADGSNATRKLCPYPQNAVYTGGEVGHWESYTCT